MLDVCLLSGIPRSVPWIPVGFYSPLRTGSVVGKGVPPSTRGSGSDPISPIRTRKLQGDASWLQPWVRRRGGLVSLLMSMP